MSVLLGATSTLGCTGFAAVVLFVLLTPLLVFAGDTFSDSSVSAFSDSDRVFCRLAYVHLGSCSAVLERTVEALSLTRVAAANEFIRAMAPLLVWAPMR